ncbi:hypothetical protein Y032_0043g848 [Ancylostoma ceylanicum]|uniref:Uncharacterized protein n=1 Tax=Ancylostoma ceylanicum TaxID=53326 RepID=A0A016UFH2_9BILA|nr:hypothetical protein Y032_0043g848 [Ancylostoma ceylanicum]
MTEAKDRAKSKDHGVTFDAAMAFEKRQRQEKVSQFGEQSSTGSQREFTQFVTVCLVTILSQVVLRFVRVFVPGTYVREGSCS